MLGTGHPEAGNADTKALPDAQMQKGH